MNNNALEDKFTGCLLGGAVGDALGFVTENLSRERIAKKFGRVTDYKVLPGCGYFTDDTQMTIAMAETLIEGNGFSTEIFRRKLAQWRLVFPRLSGRSTKNAALKCLLGFKNTGYDYAGSSGAMRAAPLGLFYRNDQEQLREKTIESCRATHTNRSAIASALVAAFSVSYAMNHTNFDREHYLRNMADVAREWDPAMSDRILEIGTLVDLEIDAALDETLKNSSLEKGFPVSDIMVTALYAFVKHHNDFENCIVLCANAGWDTDTMAAISGNICGAWNGLQAIPARLIDGLENSYKGRDYLRDLALSLHQGKQVYRPRNEVLDFFSDFGRNTLFLTHMLLRKPML